MGAIVVEDHDKASGLELRQPQGAQAVGLVWPGEQSTLSMGPERGHSRQPVVIIINHADRPMIHDQWTVFSLLASNYAQTVDWLKQLFNNKCWLKCL